MDRREAREILQLFRPGTKDAEDPKMAEALKYAQTDEELARWFDGHCRLYVAMRTRLKEIPVPADLRGKILRDEALRCGKIVTLRPWLLPLAAAAMAILLGVGAWMFFQHQPDNFRDYRERMTKLPQRGYLMSMTSTNLSDIHAYLLAHQCPDYALTRPLAALAGEGCATLAWRERNVSMVCLKDQLANRELYLFAMNRTNIKDAPSSDHPDFAQVRDLMTASWTVGDKIYILAGSASEVELKRYLN